MVVHHGDDGESVVFSLSSPLVSRPLSVSVTNVRKPTLFISWQLNESNSKAWKKLLQGKLSLLSYVCHITFFLLMHMDRASGYVDVNHHMWAAHPSAYISMLLDSEIEAKQKSDPHFNCDYLMFICTTSTQPQLKNSSQEAVQAFPHAALRA